MNKEKFEQITATAELLKILGHPVRLCIVRGLWRKGSCNVGHMQEKLQLPQPTISQHISKLRMAKIIAGNRQGLEITYEIVDERVVKLLEVLFPEDV